MRTAGTLALGLLLLLLATGCVSSPVDEPPADASPLLLDFRKKLDEDPTRCAHVWQQVGVHAYEQSLNGIPLTSLCSVLRCAKCGQERHECRPPRRR